MVPISQEEDYMVYSEDYSKEEKERRDTKIKDDPKNEMVSIPLTILTSRIEEAKINIAVEESFLSFSALCSEWENQKGCL